MDWNLTRNPSQEASVFGDKAVGIKETVCKETLFGTLTTQNKPLIRTIKSIIIAAFVKQS